MDIAQFTLRESGLVGGNLELTEEVRHEGSEDSSVIFGFLHGHMNRRGKEADRDGRWRQAMGAGDEGRRWRQAMEQALPFDC